MSVEGVRVGLYRPRRPGPRGFEGRGGGAVVQVQPVQTWRGSTVQVCGLYPFAAGSGAPRKGVPLGEHEVTGATVACDPVTWFGSQMISNPSMFVMSLPGKGKTTAVTRVLLGLADFGVVPMVFGDIRPDYVHVIAALGGQVIRLGGGTSHLNPLDLGIAPQGVAMIRAKADELAGDPNADREKIRGLLDAATELDADMRGRRRLRVLTLIRLSRGAEASDREGNVVARALDLLDEESGTPVMGDLLAMIRSARPELLDLAVAPNRQRYAEITEELEATLVGIVEGTRFGDMFSRSTTAPMSLDKPVVFDISQLRGQGEDVQAAAMITSWSYGFSNIAAAQIMADVGVIPRTLYVLLMDELHRVLQAGGGDMVEVIDQVTRLNRTDGTGTIMVTHTFSDLKALANEEDRAKATGFVERSGIVLYGGLPPAEMPHVEKVTPLSVKERSWLNAWASKPSMSDDGAPEDPNRGKFLIKVGGLPGIPIKVTLTAAERALRHSGYRWDEQEA